MGRQSGAAELTDLAALEQLMAEPPTEKQTSKVGRQVGQIGSAHG
jgi:hypothetical protein